MKPIGIIRIICVLLLTAPTLLGSRPPNMMLHLDISRIELEVFRLVNWARAERGLDPYRYDDVLADLARRHSANMRDFRFFAHTDHESFTPDQRRLKYYPELLVIRFAENIATGFGTTESEIAANLVESWMNSPGHRANILSPDYTHIGVGIVHAAATKYFGTQNFAFPLGKLTTPVKSGVRYGERLVLEFESMDNLPKDKLRVVVLYPDAHVKIVQGDGSYYMGKSFLRPKWRGDFFRVNFRCVGGRGIYRIALGSEGSHYPVFIECRVD